MLRLIVIGYLVSAVAGKCPTTWLAYGDNCYQFSEMRWTWGEANSMCQQRGGNLTSITSQGEKQFLLNAIKERRNEYWIGLKALRKIFINGKRDMKKDWYWTDNSPFDFANTIWRGGNPDDKGGHEDCVHFNPSGMNDNGCQPNYNYICKRSTDAADRCDLESGWHPFGDRCYRHYTELPVSWRDARKTCRQDRADLMIVDTADKYKIMRDSIFCKDTQSALWIGLSDTRTKGRFSWVNNKPLGQPTHWARNEPTFRRPGDNCVEAVSSNDFRWRTAQCANERKFICEKGQGQCARGWREYKGYCYKYNTNGGKEHYTWPVANSICQQYGAKLMQIENEDEQQHMVQILAELKAGGVKSTWLGISDTRDDNIFYWGDGSTINYSKWSKGQPGKVPGRLDCGMIWTDKANATWETTYCFIPRSFVCRMPIYMRPKKIKIPKTPYRCETDAGWNLYLDSCYRWGENPKTYDDANSECMGQGGQLTTAKDEYEMAFLASKIQRRAFLGLKYTQSGYVWSDGSPLGSKTNWKRGSPNIKDDKFCVALSGKGDHTGSWMSVKCTDDNKPICKKLATNINLPPTTPTPTPIWSKDCGWDWKWDPIENLCYQIQPGVARSWVAAERACRALGANLASIHGPHEQAFITALIHSGYGGGAPSFWIGANNRAVRRGWLWSDASPFYFFNWSPGEPNNKGGEEHCVELSIGNEGRWNDIQCSTSFPYICRKLAKSATTIAPTTVAPPLTCDKPSALVSGVHNIQDELFTAWSADPNFPPQNARLDSIGVVGGGGCWMAKDDMTSQYLQLDFMSAVFVSGIITQGCSGSPSWTSQYKLEFQYDQLSFWRMYEDPVGKDKIFTGNTDQDSKVMNNLTKPFNAQLVRLWPMEWNGKGSGGKMAMRVELLGCRLTYCSSERLITSEHRVEDAQLTASSEDTPAYGASKARIDEPNANGWVPSNSDSAPYIQVDLKSSLRIRKITLQGRKDAPQWVTKYKLMYSVDPGTPLRTYQAPYGSDLVFDGSKDQLSKATTSLKAPLLARMLRIIPTSYILNVALRFEVEGCQQGCGPVPLVTGPKHRIANSRLRARSKLSKFSAPPRSRINTKRRGPWLGAWVSKYNAAGQWIQADLVSFYLVRAVATRGREDSAQWVTAYTLKLSVNAKDWIDYKENNTLRVFEGNRDSSTLRKHYLAKPDSVRYVRLYPVRWWEQIALRWEIYGCYSTFASRLIGCFADSKRRRDLPLLVLSRPPGGLTPEMCVKTCYQRDMGFAGLQHGDECWCGNRYGRYGIASGCDKYKCPGDPRFHCGGDWANMVYRTGIAMVNPRCRLGWLPFNGSCYKSFPDKLSWNDALTFCRGIKGDLASIADKTENDFIQSYLGSDVREDAWIGLNGQRQTGFFEWSDNSRVTFTNWNQDQPNHANADEDCVEILRKSGRWNDGSCGNPRKFICKKQPEMYPYPPSPPDDKGCPHGWFGYRYSCYAFSGLFKRQRDALGECQKEGGYLVRVDDQIEQAALNTKLARLNGNFWMDLKRDKFGRFVWSNGQDHIPFTNWGSGQPSQNFSCVSMSSGRVSGLWSLRSCKDALSYICEKPREGFTTPVPSNPPPIVGTCQDGWLGVNEYCFQAFQNPPKDRLTWQFARSECQKRGGDLASFPSAIEFDTVWRTLVAGQPTPYWIGLNDRSEGKGFQWSDGSPVSFTNWDAKEPNKIGQCVEMVPAEGKWRAMLCALPRNYLCKVRKDKFVTPPSTTPPPTPGPAGSCAPDNDDWKKYGDFCYYVSPDDKKQLTWRQARSYCVSQGAELVSLHKDDENNFVWGQARNKKRDEFWIGLNEIDQKNGWKWSDKTPVEYTNWGPGEPNDHDGEENCVVIRRKEGYWVDRACSITMAFVCRKQQGAPPGTLPPPQPIVGNCPVGFETIGDKCFQLNGFNKPDRKNFTDALADCKKNGDDYTLASIHSQQENAFLVSKLYTKGNQMYIGMTRYQTHGRFLWIDNTDVTYTNWAVGFPSGRLPNECVGFLAGVARAGQWRDGPCSRKLGWICMTYKKPQLPPQPTKPSTCGPGWVPFGPGCYQLFKVPRTWSDAQNDCRGMNANLVSVLDPYEQAFVQTQIISNQLTDPMWIGLSDQGGVGKFEWADGFPVGYVNWAEDQPSQINGQGTCVQMLKKGDNKWQNIDCASSQRYYMCKTTTEKPPFTHPPFSGTCPPPNAEEEDYWLPFMRHCYLFKRTVPRMKHTEAFHECDRRGASLVSLHSDDENRFVALNLISKLGRFAWIGLIKVNGGFQWHDGTAYDFQGWAKGEPSDKNRTEGFDCVEMEKVSGRWFDSNCEVQNNFICKVPQVYPSTTPQSVQIYHAKGTHEKVSEVKETPKVALDVMEKPMSFKAEQFKDSHKKNKQVKTKSEPDDHIKHDNKHQNQNEAKTGTEHTGMVVGSVVGVACLALVAIVAGLILVKRVASQPKRGFKYRAYKGHKNLQDIDFTKY